MKFLSAASQTLLTLTLTRRSAGFHPSLSSFSKYLGTTNTSTTPRYVGTISSTQRFMSSSSSEPVQIRQIDKEALVRRWLF